MQIIFYAANVVAVMLLCLLFGEERGASAVFVHKHIETGSSLGWILIVSLIFAAIAR